MSTRTYAPRNARVSVKPASPKQIDLITRLIGEKDLSSLTPAQREYLATGDFTNLTGGFGGSASRVLDSLFPLPAKEGAPAKAQPGYYTTAQGEVFVVVTNKAKTSTYAKRLVFTEAANGSMRPSWEYAPGLGRTLAGTEPLTADAAGALGHLHGFCIICCKALTDPKSVQAGIGPVCVKRLG